MTAMTTRKFYTVKVSIHRLVEKARDELGRILCRDYRAADE